MEHTRCLIIGSGPAGYTAGIYTGRADIHPIVYEGMQLSRRHFGHRHDG